MKLRIVLAVYGNFLKEPTEKGYWSETRISPLTSTA
jgi:hypothetical protein